LIGALSELGLILTDLLGRQLTRITARGASERRSREAIRGATVTPAVTAWIVTVAALALALTVTALTILALALTLTFAFTLALTFTLAFTLTFTFALTLTLAFTLTFALTLTLAFTLALTLTFAFTLTLTFTLAILAGPFVALLAWLVEAAVHGLHAADEIAGLVECIGEGIILTLARRPPGPFELIVKGLQVSFNLELQGYR